MSNLTIHVSSNYPVIDYLEHCIIDYTNWKMSRNFLSSAFVQKERTKLNRKILYRFTIFTMINEILITKNYRILIFNNFLLKYYQLYRKTVRDKNYLFSSHRALKFFSEFFQNFLIPYFLILVKIVVN